MNILFRLLLVAFTVLVLSSCSSAKPKLEPGRCMKTPDCPQGEECVNTRCQDIYYPKNLIRQN